MADMRQIYDFAVKWCDKFRDQNIDYIELVDHWMADDCAALGFEMDCGHAFSEKYGDAASKVESLNRIIDDVTDIPLLGSAIYSQWRYFNHWAYTGTEILEHQNRAWFILALSRLALLAGENPFIFSGTLKKIRIVSNNICYGPMPEPDDEVEQHITINSEGRVWFSAYNYGHEIGRHEKARSQNFKIDKDVTDMLMEAFSTYFGNEYDEIFATDIGDWIMELTNTEGKTYKFRGSLCADFDYNGTDLSDMVRDALRMDDLYVFDGNAKPDVITKLTMDYHRVTKLTPRERPADVTWDKVTWDYSERFIIDGKTDTLEHVQNIGTGCRVTKKYEVEEGISSFLKSFDAEELFAYIEGNPEDVVETSDETKDYVITIDYKKNPQRVITGTFDRKGLPEDYSEFIEEVFDFMRFYGFGELFNPAVYGKAKRCKSEYIFCSVTFDEGYKSYYYLTDDDSIEIGDTVVVPAGKDNHEAIVEVVNIEYFDEYNAPLPLDKTKKILRKYEEDGLSE